MGTFLESTKVFNELRNGPGFSLKPTEFTTVLKANTGGKIKIVSKFRVFWNIFATPTNLDTFTVAVVDGGHSITSAIGQNFESVGFKVGDTFTFIDNKGGGIGTAPGQVITLINAAYMEFTINAPLVPDDYTDAILHGTNQLDNIIYDFNLTATSDSQNLVNDIFNLVQSYEFSGLIIAGADINGVAKLPVFWKSGSAIARQLATVNTFEQVYEVEVILTVPYYKEGQLSNLEEALKPFPFNVETQFYKENVTLGVGNNAATNRKFNIPRALNDSIGYFNENFDGGARQYSLISVDYEEKTSGDSREVPEITETTKVTVVMASNNTTMTANDPAVVSFSYLPVSDDYLSGNDDFNDTWNYDSLRGLLDGSVIAGTNIIKNLDLNIDNPNQITFTFDLVFSQAQQDRMFPSGNFILAIENEDPALAVESSNRLNLIIDVNIFTKNIEIPGLLVVIKDEVYYHNDVFIDGVTSGTTDLQAWNESYIMRDIRFKLITDTVLVEINRMFAEVIAFNPANGDFFVIQSVEIPSVTQAITTDSGKKIQNINLNGTRGFLIPVTSQFNKLVVVTDTFSDPDQFYKIQVGVMLNWETWEELLTDPSFFDANKPNNNQNKKTSNYSDLNGFEIRLAMLYQVKKNNIITDYHTIQDNGAVFDYDLDKNGSPKFTTTHVYKDANDTVLPLKLIIDEDNEVTVTNDDGIAKVSPDDFNGQIRLEVFEQGNEKSIHIISSIDGVIAGDILKPLDGEILMNRSLVGGNFTSKCLVDGVQLGLKKYSISSEIQEEIVFDPILSPNLKHHYDATGLVTNTDNSFGTVDASDKISVWKNLIGGIDNLIQVVASEKPLLDNTNKKVIFDGINDSLANTSVSLDLPRTICFVGQASPAATGRFFAVRKEVIKEASVLMNANNIDVTTSAWDGGLISIDGATAGFDFAMVWRLVIGSSPRWYVQYYADVSNASLSTEKTIGSLDMSGTPTTIDQMIAGNSIFTVPLDGDLREVLIYDKTLTDGEGESVISFFKTKWG